MIYAHRAQWYTTSAGIDRFQPRQLAELTAQEELAPPTTLLKTPLYQAKIEPDIYFLGFDLTVDEARGGDGVTDFDPGWFFVIRERPGEPRFGLDVASTPAPPLVVWNDLSWNRGSPSPIGGPILPLSTGTSFTLAINPPTDSARHAQWSEDKHVDWGPNATSADIAYILYQAPAMVAVHAAEMLSG
jgi:hypothetical protein